MCEYFMSLLDVKHVSKECEVLGKLLRRVPGSYAFEISFFCHALGAGAMAMRESVGVREDKPITSIVIAWHATRTSTGVT